MEPVQAKGINGQVSFDGTTVKITREGFVARSTHGRSEKALPLKSIGAVQWKPATSLVNGFIQFSVSGESSKKSVGFGKYQDATKDENSVVFRKSQLEAFEAVHAAIQEAQSNGSPAASAPDVTEQLARLGQLRDAGVLTEEEFAAKKAELLERL